MEIPNHVFMDFVNKSIGLPDLPEAILIHYIKLFCDFVSRKRISCDKLYKIQLFTLTMLEANKILCKISKHIVNTPHTCLIPDYKRVVSILIIRGNCPVTIVFMFQQCYFYFKRKIDYHVALLQIQMLMLLQSRNFFALLNRKNILFLLGIFKIFDYLPY